MGFRSSRFCAAHENRNELITLVKGDREINPSFFESLRCHDVPSKIKNYHSAIINQNAMENFGSHHVCSFLHTMG